MAPILIDRAALLRIDPFEATALWHLVTNAVRHLGEFSLVPALKPGSGRPPSSAAGGDIYISVKTNHHTRPRFVRSSMIHGLLACASRRTDPTPATAGPSKRHVLAYLRRAASGR